jgi:hypothetical protein
MRETTKAVVGQASPLAEVSATIGKSNQLNCTLVCRF